MKNIGIFFRVGPKSSLTQTKLSEHETNRGEAEKSECVSGEIFEILGQAATAIEPREGALDNPASRQKLKPFGVIGAFDDFDFEVRQKFGRSLERLALDIRRQQRAFVKTGTSRTRSREQARRRHDLEYRLDERPHAAAGLTYRRGYGASCP